ncbi:MAG: hypothetical protein GXY70_05445 [Euryarchaeota archaeon]|nr:hypothetical protein [Euryarchaeota archaeon]
MAVSSDKISKNTMRRLVGMYFDPKSKEVQVPCYLLGQLGKNDEVAGSLSGDELMQIAMQAIQDSHRVIGGRFVKVDCADREGLLRFYGSHGFRAIQHHQADEMTELVCFL